MAALVQTTEFIRAEEARDKYRVNGKGLTVAVLDTGLNTTHVDFAGTGRIPTQRNFTADNGGDVNNAKDGNGHGTNVGGIVVAHDDHIGIAPGGNIIPLKVLNNQGSGSFAAIDDALKWVLTNHEAHKISVINVSISDSQNHTNDSFGGTRKSIRDTIKKLRDANVAVVISAGNDFHGHGSTQGMGFPAICRESISTGAVFDADIGGPVNYQSGATANTTGAGRITPFSQRLHESTSTALRTDIFAPGAPLTSSGIQNNHGESIQHGTSQAAPVTAGVIMLLQEYHLRVTGELPKVDDLGVWMRHGEVIMDGDDEDDNVTNTNKKFVRVDAMQAFAAADGVLRQRLRNAGTSLKKK